ncbi:MAG TPA: 50S ribosomal protein L21 [Bacteroidales bacterium]|nr:50S ribosomal protein L21 [Bacteroidales bacterium]
MYAIVEIAGQQFKVEEGKKIFVHRLEAEEGKELVFDKVLLTDDGTNVTVGAPVISDIVVSAKVVDHVRGEKVIVFKKKRKKGYRVKNGHRQNFTQIEILSINGKTSKKKAAKAEAADAAEHTAEKKERKTAAKKAVKETEE